MTNVPRALLAIDSGAATTSVALIGKPHDRWRLLGSLAAPAGTPADVLAAVVADRLVTADLALADHVGVSGTSVEDLPRLEATSSPPETLALFGASVRAVRLLEAVAARTPWRIRAASPESHDPREMTELALRPEVTAVLVGAGDPPGPDERGWLDDLAGLVGAVARRRPELRVVLAGPIAERAAWAEGFGSPLESSMERILAAPAIGLRSGPDEELRDILDRLLPGASDARHMSVRAVLSLADALDRRIELLDIGLDGAVRALADPGVADQGPSVVAVRTAQGALVPLDIDDAAVDSVLAWTTGSLDRHRMGDRLLDLRAQPWANAAGDGARLRLAAGRAALSRLAERSHDIGQMASPDVTIVAGGAFAVAPARAVAMAIADTIRRPGATQLTLDHARLLGPVGTIDDPDERRDLIADLADDLLAPLGSLVVVGSVPTSRRSAGRAGRLTLDGDRHGRHDLTGGDVAFVDLPPGDQALATLEFRDAVRIGHRARRVAVQVSGGVAGLAVDLRDVPLRLPERRDRRRAALAEWGQLAWPDDER
ncbi:MAG TPA: hypothetical protein VE011_11855 [Candidatus Dormibacteraeota bacterium]|nr:hypothetical protein [Candidatus Dormibacteraeota bacterium]